MASPSTPPNISNAANQAGNAIKNVADIIYIMLSNNNPQYDYFKLQDVMIINDLRLINNIKE